MKIADGLFLQRDLTEEAARLDQLAKDKGWEWSQRGTGEVRVSTFDLDANHKRVIHIKKLHRKLSRAITFANNFTELSMDDKEFAEFL